MEKLLIIKSKKAKFTLSFISATIFQFGVAILISLGNLNVYFLSYIHNKDEWVNMQYGNLMMPAILLFLFAFSPLSGVMENLVGPRITLMISGLIMEISLFLFYLQRNLWLFYGIALLLGFGSGLSVNVAIRNACYYYPRLKGLIGSGIMSISGLGIGLYSAVGERIINPDGEEIKDVRKNPFYSDKVAINTKKFFLFAMCVIPVSLVLSLILFYKYDPSCEVEMDEMKGPLLEEGKKKEDIKENEEQKGTKEVIDVKATKKDKKEIPIDLSNSYLKPAPKHNIKKILLSFRFWRNIIFAAIMPFWGSFLMSTYRAYVSMIEVDPKIIKNLSAILSVISALLGPVWAFSVDKVGFPPVIKVMGIILICLSVYFIFFIADKNLYVIGLIVSFCTRIGIMSTINPHIMHVFGMRYFLIIGGFFQLFNYLFSFLASILSVILSVYYKNAAELKRPYKIVAMVCTGLSVFGFILTFFETNKKFDFGDEQIVEEQKNDKEKINIPEENPEKPEIVDEKPSETPENKEEKKDENDEENETEDKEEKIEVAKEKVEEARKPENNNNIIEEGEQEGNMGVVPSVEVPHKEEEPETAEPESNEKKEEPKSPEKKNESNVKEVEENE